MGSLWLGRKNREVAKAVRSGRRGWRARALAEALEGRILMATQEIAEPLGPIISICVGDQLDFQLYHENFETLPTDRVHGQIFSPSTGTSPADAGFFIRIAGTDEVYGHTGGASGGTGATNYTPVSNTMTQTGTLWQVTTVATSPGTATGSFLVTQTTTYRAGNQYFLQTNVVRNTGTADLTFDAFAAADIYLAQADQGVGLYNATADAVGGTDRTGQYHIFNQPTGTLLPQYYQEDHYGTIWSVIGTQDSHFNNQIFGPTVAPDYSTNGDPNYFDNGAGHEWAAITIAPGASVTISYYWGFGNITAVTNAVGNSLTGLEGQLLTGTLAEFDSGAPDASSFYASVDWGDGSASSQVAVEVDASTGKFLVTSAAAPHLYAHPGTYYPIVSIQDINGGQSQSVTANVTIGDVAMSAAGKSFTVEPGVSWTGQVAVFGDLNVLAEASGFTAVINWGDGASSVGTITKLTQNVGQGTGFIVSGTHTYAAGTSGRRTVVVTITETWTTQTVVGTGTADLVGTQLVAMPLDPAGGGFVALKDRVTGLERMRLQVVNPMNFGGDFNGQVRYSTGDVNGDGYVDVVTAIGPGGGPWVTIFSGKDGSSLGTIGAFEEGSRTGVNVAVADLDGDGRADIITARDSGSLPEVRVYSGLDLSLVRSFMAYDQAFTGGVRVAAADIGGRGYADLIVAPGRGTEGRPVKYYDGRQWNNYYSFDPFGADFRDGISVAAGDVYGDGRADVLLSAGSGPGGPSYIINYSTTTPANPSLGIPAGTAIQVTRYRAYDEFFTNGVNVATSDYNVDGRQDIVLTTTLNGQNYMKVFDPLRGELLYFYPA